MNQKYKTEPKQTCLWLTILFFFLCLLPVRANAAAFQTCYSNDDPSSIKIGSVTISYRFGKLTIRNTKTSKTHRISGLGYGNFMTDGKTVYFTSNSDADSFIGIHTVGNTSWKKVRISNTAELYLTAKYGSRLYFDASKGQDLEHSSCHFLDLKTNKFKKIKTNYHGEKQYKQYLYLSSGTGDPKNSSLYVLNLKTGKIKLAVKSRCSYFFKGSVMYYGVLKNGSLYPETLYRCSLTGASKKKMGIIKTYNEKKKWLSYKDSAGKTKKLTGMAEGFSAY